MKQSGNCRLGMTIAELLVSVAILGVLTAVIGHFVSHVNQATQRLEHFQMFRWEVENARELIGSWHPEEITADRISSIPFSPHLKEVLQEPSWKVDLQTAEFQGVDLQNPILAIRLTLSARYRDQDITPSETFFWVPSAEPESDEVESVEN